MWPLVRTATYGTFFVGLLLVFLPARLLSLSGITPVPSIGLWQVCGLVVAGTGAAVALWCALLFATIGKGTPAPFDPPRRLVVEGPYRFVRNPMYIGAVLALAGAALFYQSIPLLIYASLFWLVTHIVVVRYEEPTLQRMFGKPYELYCERVGRWWAKS